MASSEPSSSNASVGPASTTTPKQKVTLTVRQTINWHTSESNKCLLSLQLPEPSDQTPAELKLHPYSLPLTDAKELRDALSDAINYLETFAAKLLHPDTPK